MEKTTGFNMKDIILPSTILHVKEVGGSANIRPYWPHYLGAEHGLIYVIDSSIPSLDEDADELHKLLSNPAVRGVPCLILATHQDNQSARSCEALSSELDLDEICSGRRWLIHACISSDVASVQEALQEFTVLLSESYDGNS